MNGRHALGVLLLVAGCARPGSSDDSSRGSSPSNSLRRLSPGDHSFELEHGGLTRRYLVHVPNDATVPSPVVLGLHGGGGEMTGAQRAYGLDAQSDTHGFVVVYPEGVGKKRLGKRFAKWNVGACCRDDDGPDDVAFIRAVLDELATKTAVDPQRVYATGLSNGSMMAQELGCRLSDRIAAISATGSVHIEPCRPTRPVPTLYVAGKLDPCMKFDGGPDCGGCWQRVMRDMGIPVKEIPQWPCPSVRSAIEDIVSRNKCEGEPERLPEQDGAACEVWSGCDGGAQVQLCVDPKLGHQWPGGPEARMCERRPGGKLCRAFRKNVGPRSDTFDLAAMSWAFFERFQLPG